MLATREDDQHNKQTKLGREFDAPDEERLTWLPRDGGQADGGGTRIDERPHFRLTSTAPIFRNKRSA